MAKASEKWLAVGHEKGSIVLMQKVNEQWLDYSQLQNNPQTCCTDLHIETKSQGEKIEEIKIIPPTDSNTFAN